jgi:hypothetical protein
MRLSAPALLVLQLVAAVPVFAATELRLLPASQVWLDGTTNVHAWHCAGGSLDAELSIDAPVADLDRRLADWQRRPSGSRLDGPGELPASWAAEVELRIPISALRCGNAAMEHDMRKALRADRYPEIGYRFVRLREARYVPAGAVPSFALQVEGEISLAGTSRLVVIDVTATRLTAHHYRLRGGLPLRMTEFGIKPPVALLGLIRARDEIWVSVDLEIWLEADGRALAGAGAHPTPVPAAH